MEYKLYIWDTDFWEIHGVHGIYVQIVGNNGYMAWYKNNVRHRENGPAIIWPDGHQDYYFNGEHSNEK